MTVAFLVAVVLCVLVVPVVQGCDNLAAGSCALSRDSCRYALLRSFSTVAFVLLISTPLPSHSAFCIWCTSACALRNSYPDGSSVNVNACSECWPTYFACVKTADCKDDSFYGSTLRPPSAISRPLRACGHSAGIRLTDADPVVCSPFSAWALQALRSRRAGRPTAATRRCAPSPRTRRLSRFGSRPAWPLP
jgi:hypothetical protein